VDLLWALDPDLTYPPESHRVYLWAERCHRDYSVPVKEYIFPVVVIVAILGSVFGTAIWADLYFLR
jgi:secreted trypsin-like serine protease